MGESLHLGRFRGISVGVNWSLVPVFVLVAWSLATTLLPSAAPGHAGWGYWLFALLTAAAFYASLLAHELGHALLARRHGVGVRGIVLWVFGGVAQLEGDTPSPRAELELAAAGPAVSLALAAAGLGAAAALAALRADSLLVAAVGWLGAINALLAVFNLLPAFPLDGGRILRSLLWWRWGDRERATAAAARVGRAGGAPTGRRGDECQPDEHPGGSDGGPGARGPCSSHPVCRLPGDRRRTAGAGPGDGGAHRRAAPGVVGHDADPRRRRPGPGAGEVRRG